MEPMLYCIIIRTPFAVKSGSSAEVIIVKSTTSTKDIYFACKAINYRTKSKKSNPWDGDRSLSVFIKWSLINKILFAEFVMDKPLEVKANIVGNNIRDILNKLNISSKNFNELKKIMDKNINFAE